MAVNLVADARSMHAGVVGTDAELVAAARREPREFLALYDRYFDRVLGYVRLRIRDAATCEDVTSHVFTTALAQLGRFRGDGSFAGWLFQIARNAVRDVQRQRTTDPFLVERVASERRPRRSGCSSASEQTSSVRRSKACAQSISTCSRCATAPASGSRRSE
ncbi:MAG TPA: sigma-70 family RNA polymerase sigma factor [Solirubrobacteraceae bacterium]|nr:sigma-70 family RNA polymerase sigma factor [Solirubrobacteraceae bacterium]